MSLIMSKSSASQDSENYTKRVYARLVLVGDTAAANITAFPKYNEDVRVFAESNAQPTAAMAAVDAGNNIGTLDSNAAPAVIGIIVVVQDAAAIIDVTVPTVSIVSTTAANMTAGVVATTDLAGTSTTGISASKNMCFTMSCTHLDLDSAISNHLFDVIITYRIDKTV